MSLLWKEVMRIKEALLHIINDKRDILPVEKRKRYQRMIIDKIALILTIIGALNWGGIGLFSFDTVAWICGGSATIAARIIYTLVALAGIWCISLLSRPEEDTAVAEHH